MHSVRQSLTECKKKKNKKEMMKASRAQSRFCALLAGQERQNCDVVKTALLQDLSLANAKRDAERDSVRLNW